MTIKRDLARELDNILFDKLISTKTRLKHSLSQQLNEAVVADESRRVLSEYVHNVNQILTENQKITITIEDENKQPKVAISNEAKAAFVEKAQSVGEFQDPIWVESFINGLKQAGVQGVVEVKEDEQPITRKEIKFLIEALVELLSPPDKE